MALKTIEGYRGMAYNLDDPQDAERYERDKPIVARLERERIAKLEKKKAARAAAASRPGLLGAAVNEAILKQGKEINKKRKQREKELRKAAKRRRRDLGTPAKAGN